MGVFGLMKTADTIDQLQIKVFEKWKILDQHTLSLSYRQTSVGLILGIFGHEFEKVAVFAIV